MADEGFVFYGRRPGFSVARPEPSKRAKSMLPRVMSAGEIEAFFSSFKKALRYDTGRRDKAIFMLQYCLALRMGEVVYLRLKDVDLSENGSIVVPREGKSGERVVGVPNDIALRHALNQWLEARKRWGVESEYFFCTRKGTRIAEQQLRLKFQTMLKRAKIDKPYSSHCLRHTRATELVREGMTLPVLSKVLGHKNMQTTLIYLHATSVEAVAAMNNAVKQW